VFRRQGRIRGNRFGGVATRGALPRFRLRSAMARQVRGRGEQVNTVRHVEFLSALYCEVGLLHRRAQPHDPVLDALGLAHHGLAPVAP
jgi:hypothetical protein